MTKLQNFKTKKSKGFTLVEILTVVFLGSVIIMAGYSVYLMSYTSYKKSSESSELTQNARIALERMSRDIRQAQEIVTELPENPGAGTPPSEIKFQDGHVVTPVQYVRYYLSGTDLYKETSHYCFSPCSEWVLWSTKDGDDNSPESQIDANNIKAQKITNLQFWGEETIAINLTVSDGSSSYTFETKIFGRNL